MSRTLLALDVPRFSYAVQDKLRGLARLVLGVKVGMQLFTAQGPEVVRRLVEAGFKVFLDLKFKDIPNTVAGAVEAAVRLRVFMINVHCGSRKMMLAAAEAAKKTAEELQIAKPLIIGVTVLTSEDEKDLEDDGYPLGYTVPELVIRRALRAKDCGLDGVVASPLEAAAIREACGPDFVIVTPGIKLADKTRVDDQKRTGTAGKAIADGTTYLVVGRPIMDAADPVAAATAINEEVTAALAAV